MISVNKGGLSGGDYFSLAGIESSTLGSKTSLLTRVVAGVHYKDLEELGNLFNELKLLVAEHNAAPHGAADPKEFARKRSLIATRTQEVRSRVYEQYNPKINIKKMLYEGVNLTIGSVNDNTLGERKGPISIIENSIEGGLRFLGMTSLAYKAQMIEQTFIKQHQIDQQKNWSTMKEETA
jgi:hypothetical protein